VSWDPYRDLESSVLRNRLGITDRAELAHVEAELTASRIFDLRRTRLPGNYDMAHLKHFHRVLFSDLYDWAGQVRTVSIGKGALFCLPQHIEATADEMFRRLARDRHLRGLSRPQFVDALTELFADANALHPFREGNGRTLRAFLTQLAREAGHPIRWVAMDPEVNITASRAAHHGDNRLLHDMLDQLVTAGDDPETGHRGQRPPRPREPGD